MIQNQKALQEGYLSVQQFKQFYEEGRLDTLSFPNGQMTIKVGHDKKSVPYFARLPELYELLNTQRETGKSALALGLIGIVSMGDTVTSVNYYLQPEETEFLILTEDNPVPWKYDKDAESQKSLCELRSGRIHAYIRSANQLLGTIRKQAVDEQCARAFPSSIPIVFDHNIMTLIEYNMNPVYPHNNTAETPKKEEQNVTPFMLAWYTDNDTNKVLGKIAKRSE